MNPPRRFPAFVLVLVMLFGMLVPGVCTTANAAENETFYLEKAYINPLYEGLITEDDLVKPNRAMPYADNTTDRQYSSARKSGELIRDDLVARDQTIYVNSYCAFNGVQTLEADLNALVSDVFDWALIHTGNPVEGDYLVWQYAGYKVNGNYNYNDNYIYAELCYTVTYYTNASQEAQMDTAVSQLLASMNVDNADNYTKLKAIYDYICENVQYDHDNLNDTDYMLKHTAYAALINKTAVCQGYALLLYRLALELGVDCRLISGESNGPHGWNIAEIDGLYYNLDATRDAGSSNYRCFLVCPNNFPNHVRDVEYDTAAFHSSYPMADADYVACTHTYKSQITKEPTCTADGVKTYTCSACSKVYTETITATGHTYEDGRCANCGAQDPDYKPEADEMFDIYGTNMTLGNSLDMNFFIEPADMRENESYYAIITKAYADGRDSLEVRVDQADWNQLSGSNPLLYVTLGAVAAKEMSDNVTVVIYNSKDEAVSNVYTDSVRAYTMRALIKEEGQTSPNKDKLAMYVDMLNYGAAAQEYFSYNVSDLANNLLSTKQKDYATSSVVMVDKRVKGEGYVGTNLTLESNIIMNFFFNNIPDDHKDMYAIATFTNHYGEDVVVRIEGEKFGQLKNDTRWYVPVSGIVVADCSQLVTLKVYNANGTVIANAADSIESYVARASAISPLYTTIMKFAVSAKAALRRS